MLRKFLTSALCVMVALSGVTVTKAQEPTEQPVEEVDPVETTVEETTEPTDEAEDPVVEAEAPVTEEAEQPAAEETEEETEVTAPAEETPAPEVTPSESNEEETETPEEVITTATGTQRAYLVGDDWGVAVSKTILSLDKAVDASSVSADKFVVSETKQWYGGISTLPRSVLNAYISDANGNVLKGGWGPAPTSSKYVTIEMYISPSDGSAFVYTGLNNWCDPYELNVSLAEGAVLTSGEEKIATLNVKASLDLSGTEDKICPQLDGVELHGSLSWQEAPYAYTAADGTEVVVPYAYYAPANDGHKNPIIIWNHGGGERGTDPQIAVLANKVTSLWDSEIQNIMDGAYVIAPQVPSDGSTDANRADAIVQLVKDLAAANSDIDLSRVYVAGCSMGGGMTLTLIKNHPDFFAAAVPICPAGSLTEEDAKNLVNLPIWYIHAENDPTVPYADRTAVQIPLLEAAGNTNVHLSLFDDVHDTSGRFTNEDGTPYQYAGHWSWIYFYNNECYDENGLNCWEWMAQQTKTIAVSGTQRVEVVGDEWGAGVTKTIVKLDKEIRDYSVSKEDFEVIENKDGQVTTRTIIDAYLADENGNKAEGSSQYVAIELGISPTEGNPITWSMVTWRNTWPTSYKLYVNLTDGAKLVAGEEIVDNIKVAAQIDVANDMICKQLDGVELNSYTYDANGKDVVIPYGFYAPAEDGHKNGIIVWNHGIGEGGTDPKIAILGNEVTELWDEDFQNAMDGCYVLVAQVPNDGSRDNDRADAIVALVKELAANNADIDLDRVYVAGCSAGGGMTLTLMKTHADFFAAALPICPAGSLTEENAKDLVNLPMWFIHAENDDTVKYANSTAKMVPLLRSAGAEVHTSIFADVHNTDGRFDDEDGNPYQYSGHWSWVYFFNNECYDEDGLSCFEWLAKQTKADTRDEYTAGVVVTENTDFPETDAKHQATFTYIQSDDEANIKSITISGSFQFFTEDQMKAYNAGEDFDPYTVYEYKQGMFPAGYDPSPNSVGLLTYPLEEVANGVYQVTLPLPSTEHYYDYNILYWGAEKAVTIQDPANPAVDNEFNGHDCGHSLLWVGSGDAEDVIAGQEYVFARDGQNGTVEFKTYTAVDGTEQPIGIYTPYGYNESKTYNVVYVSHGGGGNEVDWHYIGAIQNIFDNLIAEGEVAPTIVVTLDHTYFGWNMDVIKDNLMNYVIPYMEENYSVSTDPNGRAFCGLSMGGLTTTSVYATNAGDFGYLGIWSATNGSLDVAAVENNTFPEIMLAAGCFDFGKGGYPGLMESMDAAGVKYTYSEVGGAHDWGVWRNLLTTFAKDYLWERDIDNYTAGVNVTENTNPEWNTDYVGEFVFKNTSDKKVVSVGITGNIQFYRPEEVTNYDAAGDNSNIPSYSVYEYEEGMFNTGYGINGDTAVYYLDQVAEDVFALTLPLPSTLYAYDYVVTYADGTTVTMKDPANMPVANTNGHDAGHSLLYVGSRDTALAGQEYIYPRTDGKTGEFKFYTYTAIDGTEQPIGVYLPYGYSVDKQYKTIYVSHGGGGNENEWMTIGAVPNIMDNLIAEGLTDEAIVVTMDNTYFGWDHDQVLPNIVDYIIPYVEAHFSVSKDAEDRAFCGLSAGSMVTNQMAKVYPNEFGYFGAFSGGNRDLDPSNYDADALNNVVYYLTAGSIDMAYNNNLGISSVDYLAMLDKLGVDYTFELKNGAHDWGVWRDSFTTFAKDYLWNNGETPVNPVNPDKPTDPTKPVNPSTGDTAPVAVYAMVGVVALAGLALVAAKKKKENA